MKRDLETIYKYTKTVGDCLVWKRALNSDGYPRASVNGDTNVKVHRLVYVLTHPNENIKDKVIRHTCDNPRCLNYKHLVSGTSSDNNKDRDLRNRNGRAKITREQAYEIRYLHKVGKILQKVLAAQYGLDHRTISSIVNGHHWKRDIS